MTFQSVDEQMNIQIWRKRFLPETLGLVLIVILALGVRLYGLDAQSYWSDELASINIARLPLHRLWSPWMLNETNPPLYYTLIHVWIALVGDAEAQVRLLSALIGTGCVVLIYRLGRELASIKVGLIGAFLCALWPHQIYFSQEARGYILAAFGVLLAMQGLVEILARVDLKSEQKQTICGEYWPYWVYGLGTLIALYSHTTLIFFWVLSQVGLAWIWLQSSRSSKILITWTIFQGGILILWLWWLWITWQQINLSQGNTSWIAKPSLSQALSMVLNMYGPAGVTLGKSTFRLFMLGVGGVFMALAGWGILQLKRPYAILLLIFVIGGPLLEFLISQKVTIMLPRTLLWGQFVIILGVANANMSLNKPLWRGTALGLIVVSLLAGKTLFDTREPWRPLVQELAQRLGPNDVVIVTSPPDGVYIETYCHRYVCRFQRLNIEVNEAVHNRWADSFFKGERVPLPELRTRLSPHNEVWAITHWDNDPNRFLSDSRYGLVKTGQCATALPDYMGAVQWKRVSPAKAH